MTDQILALVPTYGLPLLAVIVALSCLALPVPSSLVMLTSGSFVGAGELALLPTFLTALFSAALGDQIGFAVGKSGGPPVLKRLMTTKERRAFFDRASHFVDQKGGAGVFLSRWLVSPLGPYVNFIGGATGLNWLTFTLWGVAGEAVWVSVYVGLGVVFSDNITAAAELARDASGFLAAGVVAIGLGWRLRHVLRKSTG